MRRPWRAVCIEACTSLFEDVPWRAIAAFYTMTTASMSTMRANAVTGAKRSEVSLELLRAADVGLIWSTCSELIEESAAGVGSRG